VLLSLRLRLRQCRMGFQKRTRSSARLQISSRCAGSPTVGAAPCGVGARDGSLLGVRAACGVRARGGSPSLLGVRAAYGVRDGAAPTPGPDRQFGVRGRFGVPPTPGAHRPFGDRARDGAGIAAGGDLQRLAGTGNSLMCELVAGQASNLGFGHT